MRTAWLSRSLNLVHGPITARRKLQSARTKPSERYWMPTGGQLEWSMISTLQGSYRNDTNIRGDSDVDVVVQMTSSFHHEADQLLEFDRNRLSALFQPGTYGWNDFRREALKALEAGFGKSQIAQGNKSIKLKADPPDSLPTSWSVLNIAGTSTTVRTSRV